MALAIQSPIVRQRGGSQRRVLELDGLRAFAILPVILLHCRPLDGHWRMLSAIGEHGGIGVSLFFVLSGYLITGILLDSVRSPHYYRNFVVRRAIRIFPLYYATLTILMLCPGFFATSAVWVEMRTWGLGWFFVYAGNLRQAWMAQWPPVVSFSPLWSLQVEEQFYLLFPLIVSLLSRRNLARFLIVSAIVAPVLRCALVYSSPSNWMAAAVLTPCRMDALALGGLVALLVRAEVVYCRPEYVPRLQYASAALAGLAACGSLFVKQDGSVSATPFSSAAAQSCVNVAFAAFLCWVLFSPTSRLVTFFRARPLTYIGQISYGLYLLHIPASWVVRAGIKQIFGSEVPAHSRLAVPVTYGAALIAAGLSWRFFESPLLQLKDRFFSRQQARMVSRAPN